MKQYIPVVWFEIYVQDMSRAKKFYEKVFDVQLNEIPTPNSLDDDMKMVVFPTQMDAPGAGGALVQMDGARAGVNSTIVYFYSEDCSIEEGRIEGAGGKVCTSKQSIGDHGFIVMALDTEGNMFGIHSIK